MSHQAFNHYLKLLLQFLAPYLLVGVTVLLLFKLTAFFLPFAIALLIAWISHSIVVALQKRVKLPKKAVSVFVTILVLLAFLLLSWLLISGVLSLLTSIAKALPSWVNSILSGFDALYVNYGEFLDILPAEAAETLYEFRTDITTFVARFIPRLASPTLHFSLTAVKSVPDIFISVLMFFLAIFVFINDWDRMAEWLSAHLPRQILDFTAHLKSDIKKIFGSWLLAQFKLMLVVFAVLAVSFLVLRINYAIPLALITALLDFLPAFGVGFIMWPWAVFELLIGHYMMFVSLTVIYILTQVIRRGLEPKIMGSSFGIPTLLALFSMFAGYRLYGLTGLIFSIPAMMVLFSLYRYGIFDRSMAAGKTLLADLFSITH